MRIGFPHMCTFGLYLARAQTHANTCKHMRTHANTCKHMQTHPNTPKHTQTHPNTPKHMQTHANTCKHMQTHPNTCKHMQTQLQRSPLLAARRARELRTRSAAVPGGLLRFRTHFTDLETLHSGARMSENLLSSTPRLTQIERPVSDKARAHFPRLS